MTLDTSDPTLDPTLDPTTNPDVQEALSRNYSNACVLILPLKSGRFALIDRGYKLHLILDRPPNADELRAFSLAFSVDLTSTTNLQPFRKLSNLEEIPTLDLNLDLDLAQ